MTVATCGSGGRKTLEGGGDNRYRIGWASTIDPDTGDAEAAEWAE